MAAVAKLQPNIDRAKAMLDWQLCFELREGSTQKIAHFGYFLRDSYADGVEL